MKMLKIFLIFLSRTVFYAKILYCKYVGENYGLSATQMTQKHTQENTLINKKRIKSASNCEI